MDKVVIMLKTYKEDFYYMNRLMGSFHKNNIDSLNLYIVAPNNEKKIFQQFLTDTVHFIFLRIQYILFLTRKFPRSKEFNLNPSQVI